MSFLPGFLMTLILLAALQGVVTGLLLFFAKKKRYSNRLLAVLIWLMSLASFNLYFESNGFFYSSSLIALLHAVIPLVIVMPMGPLIYFYVRSSLHPAFVIGKKERKHFFPVLIDLVPALIAIVFFTGTGLGWIVPDAAPWGLAIDTYNIYADIPRFIAMAVYVWLTAKELRIYASTHPGSDATIQWLQQFTRLFFVFLGIWFVYLVPYVLPAYSNWIVSHIGWYPVYIPLAILIYWLGIKGYLVAHAAVAEEKKKKNITELPEELVSKTIRSLEQAMVQEKRYLDPELSLAGLAVHIGVPYKTLSTILNQYLQKSFSAYLNEYRVEAFKEKIQAPGLEHLTITGIAFECGFNSQASFQRIFKQATGLSPSEFRRQRLSTP